MALDDRSTDVAELVLFQEIPDASPQALYRYWTEPELLRAWWPHEAEVDPRPGGSYHLAWPGMDWHLRGEYTAVEPDRMLAFTWRWDHTPNTPTRHVEVRFEPAEAGTRLTVRHGEYTAADAEERAGHLEGWRHFCERLVTAVKPA